MIWPALMAFARPWQAAPAAHRLVCCVLACVTLSSCAGGAPAPSVRPARASLTRFTTSVTELRQRMEERPSCVLEATKSYDQTWPRYSGLSRMHDPSLSHSRPRFGSRSGTFSPSCLQIRSTRLWFTAQPSVLSIPVTIRYR